jgi:hypothetical protein
MCKQHKAIKEGIVTASAIGTSFAAAQKYGDKTQAEMAQLWQGGNSERTMSRALARIGWTRKKRRMATENGMTPNALLS